MASALQLHICASTNIELYHELKKLNFVSVVQKSFLPYL